MARIFSCCLRFSRGRTEYYPCPASALLALAIKPLYEKGPYTSFVQMKMLFTLTPHAAAPFWVAAFCRRQQSKSSL